MKKIILIVVVFLLGISHVSASTESIYVGDKIPGVYIRKVSSSGKVTVKQGGFLKRASDNRFVYCLEPFITLIDNYTYDTYTDNFAALLGISEEVWQKINLIAYYGYQYGDHTEDYWYYVTQMMIWREVDKNGEFHFTATLGGPNDDSIFADEIKEIEYLVARHYVTPDFGSIDVLLGDTQSFWDNNEVLSNYQVIDNENVSIKGNELIVNANSIGSEVVLLRKYNDNFKDIPLVYIDNVSQKVFSAGYLDSVDVSININVHGAKIKIYKVDAMSGEAVNIAGIKFQIYDTLSNTLVLEGETNQQGIFESDALLAVGSYKLVEVRDQVIPGYQVSDKEIFFEIKKGDREVTFSYENYPVLGSIRVIKSGEDGKLLSGVEFGLYDENGVLLSKGKTNQDGILEFSDLKEGIYKIKELATVDDYLIDDKEYIIELKLEDNKINEVVIELENKLPKGSLEILKVDEYGQVLAGAEFALYDEYDNLVAKAVTDQSGKATFLDIYLGNYYLKEVLAPSGYQLVDDTFYVEITDNRQVINIKVVNVKVPDTGIELNEVMVVLPTRKSKKFVHC